MALKDDILSRGMKLIQDPRVAKFMQDPRVIKTLMQALELRSKVQESFEERVARIAKSLNLVTKKEVRQLERTLRKLERELAAARAAGTGPSADDGRGATRAGKDGPEQSR